MGKGSQFELDPKGSSRNKYILRAVLYLGKKYIDAGGAPEDAKTKVRTPASKIDDVKAPGAEAHKKKSAKKKAYSTGWMEFDSPYAMLEQRGLTSSSKIKETDWPYPRSMKLVKSGEEWVWILGPGADDAIKGYVYPSGNYYILLNGSVDGLDKSGWLKPVERIKLRQGDTLIQPDLNLAFKYIVYMLNFYKNKAEAVAAINSGTQSIGKTERVKEEVERALRMSRGRRGPGVNLGPKAQSLAEKLITWFQENEFSPADFQKGWDDAKEEGLSDEQGEAAAADATEKEKVDREAAEAEDTTVVPIEEQIKRQLKHIIRRYK